MITLRVDPWAPEYGAGVEIDLGADETAVQVDTTIETNDWSRPIVASLSTDQRPLFFVDGVRRVELRLLAEEDDGRRAWGICGSFAIGAVKADGQARFDRWSVGRALIVNSGMSLPDLHIELGGQSIAYQAISIGGSDPLGPIQALQNRMREAEGRLAAELAPHGVVVADGPLTYPLGPGLPIVGVAKRMLISYLGPVESELLPRLRPGQRTPLFALGTQVLDRFAWYQRLIESRPNWHSLAGIVRCEVRTEVGAALTRTLADRMAAELGAYAARPGFDPRAPQNLTPVGALEHRLRLLMGHPLLLRRALERSLAALPPAA